MLYSGGGGAEIGREKEGSVYISAAHGLLLGAVEGEEVMGREVPAERQTGTAQDGSFPGGGGGSSGSSGTAGSGANGV